MTTTFGGFQIVSNFKREIENYFNLTLRVTSISRQVFAIDKENKCLLYVKARSAYPIRWGVTANVIDRLKNQKLSYAVVLLFLSHQSGYILSSDDVEYYIKNVWPLGSDGDYKPAEGNYLSRNNPFDSLVSLLEEIKKI
jgi:hypothetical protein